MRIICATRESFLFDELLQYILKHLEAAPDATFSERELARISKPTFKYLKQKRYLKYVQFDPEKESYYDDKGNERFVRKVNSKYFAYSTEDNNIDPLPITQEDLNRWFFDIDLLLGTIAEANKLSKTPDKVTERIRYIGEKAIAKKKIDVLLGLFADEEQAKLELYGLKSQISKTDGTLILCPALTVKSQAVLQKLESQKIKYLTFNEAFAGKDFGISPNVFDYWTTEQTEIGPKMNSFSSESYTMKQILKAACVSKKVYYENESKNPKLKTARHKVPGKHEYRICYSTLGVQYRGIREHLQAIKKSP